MIAAFQKDDALLADIAACARRPGFRLWWLGQSGYLLQYDGSHALLDPYLSESLTIKYAATDKPHVRMSERVISPVALGFVDVVSSSHNHTDHFDPDTLKALLTIQPELPIVIPAANEAVSRQRLAPMEARLLAVDAGQSVAAGPFTFHAVPAAHEQFDLDKEGRHPYLGYVVTFGPHAVYHTGDTMRYDGMAERLRQWKIDAALLPINGRGPERRVAGNLWGREAAELARDIAAGLAVPCHYDMFTFNTASPDEFIKACEQIGQPYRVLRQGERLDIPA